MAVIGHDTGIGSGLDHMQVGADENLPALAVIMYV